jgi:hypothetical protein
MPGAGTMVPPLFMRGSSSGGSTPSAISAAFRSPGARSGTLYMLRQRGRIGDVVEWPWLTSSTSILPKAPASCTRAASAGWA